MGEVTKEFAALFDETIEELGVTMYQISARTGIDTSTLTRFRQKMKKTVAFTDV